MVTADRLPIIPNVAKEHENMIIKKYYFATPSIR